MNSDLLNWVNTLDSTNPTHVTLLRDCARGLTLSDVGTFATVRARVRSKLATLPMGAPAAWVPPGGFPAAPVPGTGPTPTPTPAPGPAAAPAAPVAAVAATGPVIPPMTTPPPAVAPAGYHWEVRRNVFGNRYTLVSDTPPVAAPPRNPFPWDDMVTWFMRILLIGLGALAILALAGLIFWAATEIIDEINDEEFSADVDIDTDDNGNRNDDDGSNDNDGDGNGTIDIGGLEITTSDDYHNGIANGQIRDKVPAGYMVVGDLSTTGHVNDTNSSTGQIMILFEDTIVAGVNEGSLQKISLDNWEQSARLQATQMFVSGCMHGCAKVKVYDQNGALLATYTR